jgi:ribose transport system substrate-binding protein
MSKNEIWLPRRRDFLKVGAAGIAGAAGLPFIGRTAWGETGVEGKTIGFTMSFSNTEWIKQMQAGVVETAKKYGMNTIVYDANDQPTKQLRDIEDLLVRNVDVIIISTYYAEAIRPAVQEINRAGVPIVVLSSPLPEGADFDVLLSTDMIGTARQAGHYYVKKLNGEGNVVQIEGKPGSLINQQRGSGWREVIDAAPGIKVVSHVVANYDRTQAIRGMEDALQANPKIDAVYCHNDDMALGAVKAAGEFGREKDMFFTGFDGLTPEALEAIHNGTLDAVWEYLPFGVEGVEAAIRVLQKKPIPKKIAFESPMITKENVLEWYDPKEGKRRILPSRLSL